MAKNQVLIISFWNPTAKRPQKGIFIQEQADAVCSLRDNIVFLQVNVLPSNHLFLKKTIEESAFYNNKRIIINLYSLLWKFYYVNPWWLARLVYRIIKQKGYNINPSVIHANVIFPCGIVGYFLSGRMGAKLIISEHWSKTGKLLKHPLYKRIAMKAYHKSLAIICVSKFLSVNIAKTTGLTNLVVIPNIVNSGIFTYKPKPPVESGRLSFMCIAIWRLPKRLDLIVDALCNYALETTREINLKVVGDGSQIEVEKGRKTPENLRIEWLGYLDKPTIASLLQTSHVFLHASTTETFSIVTAEALSTGTPVLVSNTGALPELINEQNGMLTENSPESWLAGIRKIVAKQFDYESIAIYNQNKYSPLEVGTSILSVYNNVS